MGREHCPLLRFPHRSAAFPPGELEWSHCWLEKLIVSQKDWLEFLSQVLGKKKKICCNINEKKLV